MTETSEKLEPCPLCQSAACVTEVFVTCSNDACACTMACDDIPEAIRRWNTRPAPDALREALTATLNKYVEMANSGDCGFWDCEKEQHVIDARAALASPPIASESKVRPGDPPDTGNGKAWLEWHARREASGKEADGWVKSDIDHPLPCEITSSAAKDWDLLVMGNGPIYYRRSVMASEWQDISTAPKDGTRIVGRRTYTERYTGKLRYEKHKMFWGKTSHVPLYGWNYGRDAENMNLWEPTHWRRPAPPPHLDTDEAG